MPGECHKLGGEACRAGLSSRDETAEEKQHEKLDHAAVTASHSHSGTASQRTSCIALVGVVQSRGGRREEVALTLRFGSSEPTDGLAQSAVGVGWCSNSVQFLFYRKTLRSTQARTSSITMRGGVVVILVQLYLARDHTL